MKKAVISGASGFIGQHIIRLLKDKYTFVPVTQELLYSPDNLAEFFKREKPDVIFHLAAYGNHVMQDNPAMTVFANTIGTFNMLYASLQTPYTKFVQFGSSSEYGKKVHSMGEADICDPETFYGASKLGSTYLARTFAKQYGKPIIIIRPFSVYGEGEAEFRFIPTAIRKILSGEEMELDPDSVHDWILADDLVSGVDIAIDKAGNGEIINIGTGREISNQQIISILQNVTGKTLKTKPMKKRATDTNHWKADITKLMGLGWRAKYPLGLGIARTVQWYKANK